MRVGSSFEEWVIIKEMLGDLRSSQSQNLAHEMRFFLIFIN